MLNSEKIGDWYLNAQKSPAKSIYWYETKYNITKNQDVLLKLGTSIEISEDYTKQNKYYPIILSIKSLSKDQRRNYTEKYIESYYYLNDFFQFQTAYKKYAPALTNNTSVVMPLQVIIDDQSTPTADLEWALDFSNQLLKTNDNMLIISTLYAQQSTIYLRLGDSAKAALLDQKSKQVQKQLLK